MSWIKGIVAQLSVFVTATILIVIAHIFIWGSNFLGTGSPCANLFAGGRILNAFDINTCSGASLGGANVPGLNGIDPGLLGYGVALVLIMSLPNIASFIRDQISKPSRLELGLGPLGGTIRTGVGIGVGRYTEGIAPGTLGGDIADQQARVDAAKGTAAYGTELKKLMELQRRAKTLQNLSRGRLS